MLGRLGVKVVNKIKALIDKFFDIVSKAIGDKGTGCSIVQVEIAEVFSS